MGLSSSLLRLVNQSAQGQRCRLKMSLDLPHIALVSCFPLSIFSLVFRLGPLKVSASRKKVLFFPPCASSLAMQILAQFFKCECPVADFATFKDHKQGEEKKNCRRKATAEPNDKPQVEEFETYARSLTLRASRPRRPSTLVLCLRPYVSWRALKRSLFKSGGEVSLCFIN